MPTLELNEDAERLRRLLHADAVIYWRQDNPSLALVLGAAPAGIVDTGFSPPDFTGGIRLMHGAAAGALLPLRLRARLAGATAALAGDDGTRGGILAAWSAPGQEPPPQAEAAMDFALTALRSLFDLAGAHSELLRSEAQKMSGVADVLPQGVIVVPAGSRPGHINQAAAALLDLPPGPADASLLAARLAALAERATNHEEVAAQVEAFIERHGEAALSGRVWRFPGTPSALRVTVAPIAPKQAGGWLWLLEDVSAAEAEAEARERRRYLERLNAELEERVEERTRQLEQANQVLLHTNTELRHFAHAMAHDLQTPLRSIAGFAQLVQRAVKSYGNSEVEEWASQVVVNAKRLQTLIQGLLAYIRLGAQALPCEAVDMDAVFDEVAASLRALIDEKAAQVSRGPLPTVWGVRIQLGQLLQNLIENGLKYNRADHPQISVSCRRQHGEWIFAVADNGMGIDARHQEQIFEIFKRLHSHAQVPGTGIGLALCRRIVERHGGRIWVESKPGEGATFLFALPAEQPSA